MAEQIQEMLEAMAQWDIQLRNRDVGGWALTVSDPRYVHRRPPPPGTKFTYYGNDLSEVVRRAWASEEPDEK